MHDGMQQDAGLSLSYKRMNVYLSLYTLYCGALFCQRFAVRVAAEDEHFAFCGNYRFWELGGRGGAQQAAAAAQNELNTSS